MIAIKNHNKQFNRHKTLRELIITMSQIKLESLHKEKVLNQRKNLEQVIKNQVIIVLISVNGE